jgi:hypothetical protein
MPNGKKKYIVFVIADNFLLKIPLDVAISENYILVKKDKFTLSETIFLRKTPFIEFAMPIPITQLQNVIIE